MMSRKKKPANGNGHPPVPLALDLNIMDVKPSPLGLMFYFEFRCGCCLPIWDRRGSFVEEPQTIPRFKECGAHRGRRFVDLPHTII